MKKVISVIAPLAATLALLIACGSGDIYDLAEGSPELNIVDNNKEELSNLIRLCSNPATANTEANAEKCKALSEVPVSSSSEEQSSSSGETDESSSSTGEKSSSSGVASSSSTTSSSSGTASSSSAGTSSSSAASSSSAVASSSSTANTYTPTPVITCAWTPETVLTGDKTTLSISTTDANCTVFAGIAYGKLTPANGLTPAVDGRDTVVWQNGAEITANGSKLVGKNGRGDTTFTISATAGVSTTQNHVKAFAYCSADGKSGVFTQACTLKIQAPPNPVKAGTMVWTNTHTQTSSAEISSSSGYYYIGEVPVYTKDITVSNAEESRCGTVEYDETVATTTAGTNNVKIIAKCSQSGYKLDSIRASVLANPTLTGTCAWSKNPTSSAKGATPSGVTLANSYGRCGTDGAVTLFTSSAYTVWPTNGLVDAGTYADVATNVQCTSAQVEQKPCPSLTVNAGADHVLSGVDTYVNGIESGESMDMEFEWTNNGYHPDIYVRCDVEPAFDWAETVNKTKKGFIKVCYNSTCDTQNGDYGVNAKVRVVTSVQAQTYEFSGATVDIYIADSNGDNQTEATAHKAKCKVSTNGN